MSIEIIQTSDGSHSLLNTDLNETYHSHHGAVQESMHVFINHGLHFFLKDHPTEVARIFEVGFGTGLNVYLTILHCNSKVHYTSIEAFPLSDSIWLNLNYASTQSEKEIFSKLHRAVWNEDQSISDNFTLRKLQTSLQLVDLTPAAFDVIYFDAFAPNKQPEMWEMPILEKVTRALVEGGVLVTYCAKGQLKRDLKSLGMQVETLTGPPGKKEMVRALKI